ncbi:hypothetical protein NBZ79_03610 [Sneathiella marina]|uniref:Uncharacterized protein n=1 Tax=Sneathiella marina TaxID=2950108 RepID=A0ABY4W9V9_9PROT|nr:hypothetical protein [Sneathiella marina]USG62059.1 hypothetical protein NBZ79_03610 [Sneathiella marina]
MPRILPFIIFAISFGLLGWAGYDYIESGVETGVIQMTGEVGRSNPINLEPSMSPMRVLLKVEYNIELLETDNKAFEYDIVLRDAGGDVLFDTAGEHRDKREDNTPEYATKSSLIVLATKDISTAGAHIIDWKILPQKATILAQTIILRGNVRPAQWPLVILGAVAFVLGIGSLRYRRRKLRQRI